VLEFYSTSTSQRLIFSRTQGKIKFGSVRRQRNKYLDNLTKKFNPVAAKCKKRTINLYEGSKQSNNFMSSSFDCSKVNFRYKTRVKLNIE